jgi:hypothetical protein
LVLEENKHGKLIKLVISPDLKKYFLGMSDGTVLIFDSEKF